MSVDARMIIEDVNELLELVNVIPKPGTPEGQLSPEGRFLFQWAGQLREFVNVAVPSPVAAV